jgi:hypothetical protein
VRNLPQGRTHEMFLGGVDFEKDVDGRWSTMAFEDIPLQGSEHLLLFVAGVLPCSWLSKIDWNMFVSLNRRPIMADGTVANQTPECVRSFPGGYAPLTLSSDARHIDL